MKELRQIKEEIAAEHGYDIYALGDHLRQKEKESGREVVDRSRKQDKAKSEQ